MIQVQSVDMRADLHAGQPQFPDAALQLPDGQLRVLHRQRTEADEALRMLRDQSRNVVVEKHRQIVRVGAASPSS